MENKFKICFCSIDIEGDFGKSENFEGVENLDKILKIFERHKIPITLFIGGNVLEKYSEKFRELGKKYEIASHSFSHRFWDSLSREERKEELERFINHYQKIFERNPQGFRAPSHIIDEEGLKLLEEKRFLYDSSIIPHYPPFKKYRGYKGKAPVSPYWINTNLLEIPVSGQIFGIPLVGTWISKLPLFIYRLLFFISTPNFLTLNLHSWDSLNSKLLKKVEEILKLLKNKNYHFLSGKEIYEQFSKNRG